MKRNAKIGIIVAIAVFIAAVAFTLLKAIIVTAQAIELTILFGLVLVTYIYANRTSEIANATKEQTAATKQQADASVKMAKEMKEQRLAMYKPHIVIEKTGTKRGTYFMKKIGVGVANEQGGSAINVEFYIAHSLFKFTGFRYPFSISVGQSPVTHEFTVEEPSVDDDPGTPIDPIAFVVANYEDVSGNPWHSTLELHWNPTTRDITPGRMEVGVSEHYK